MVLSRGTYFQSVKRLSISDSGVDPYDDDDDEDDDEDDYDDDDDEDDEDDDF